MDVKLKAEVTTLFVLTALYIYRRKWKDAKPSWRNVEEEDVLGWM